ncbi:hypothetical protein AB0H98_30610 [Nocardia salmonicida]|uniref:hypothetical protein n=1 Tax=Nocardia salmonicida TaxID=53431 RepID=UPI0033C58D69
MDPNDIRAVALGTATAVAVLTAASALNLWQIRRYRATVRAVMTPPVDLNTNTIKEN